MTSHIRSPWVTMWSSPTLTIRRVVENPSFWPLLVLAFFFAVQYLFAPVQYLLYKSEISFLSFIVSILIAFVLAFGCFFVFALALFLSGKFIEGEASYMQIVHTFAWSMLPSVLIAIFWAFALVFLHREGGELKGHSVVFLSSIYIIASVWSLILLIKSLQEVQDFSLVKSIINLLFGLGILFVFISLIFIFSYLIIRFGKY